MSGIVSGISRVFKTVGSAAARVGKAVMGVGSTVFTAGAATGAGSMASGGLSGLFGGGTLGNIMGGALTQAGYGALIGGAIGAVTGQGFGKGALMGAAGGAVTGGISGAMGGGGLFTAAGATPQTQVAGNVPAATPTGMAPAGVAAAPPSSIDPMTLPVGGTAPAAAAPNTAAPAAPAATGGGFGQFLQSETGGALIGGLGKGLGSYMEQRSKEDMAEADRQFLREKEQRLTDSYHVDPSALHGLVATDNSMRPAPASKYARRTRYQYSPEQGRVVQVPV